nr:hypothetical protein [uncultured Campylobacter sp.]
MWYQDGYTIAVTTSGSDTDKINTYTEKEGFNSKDDWNLNV